MGGYGSPSRLTMPPSANITHCPVSCSERELTSCSLQVLSAAGSPARTMLTLLAERSCSLDFLLHCLRKMEHQEAVQFLTTAGKGEVTGLLYMQSLFLTATVAYCFLINRRKTQSCLDHVTVKHTFTSRFIRYTSLVLPFAFRTTLILMTVTVISIM